MPGLGIGLHSTSTNLKLIVESMMPSCPYWRPWSRGAYKLMQMQMLLVQTTRVLQVSYCCSCRGNRSKMSINWKGSVWSKACPKKMITKSTQPFRPKNPASRFHPGWGGYRVIKKCYPSPRCKYLASHSKSNLPILSHRITLFHPHLLTASSTKIYNRLSSSRKTRTT